MTIRNSTILPGTNLSTTSSVQTSLQTRSLNPKDIEQQFRVACDDLYVSTLKPPIVVDSSDRNSKLNKNLPDYLGGQIPSGFCIDPQTWQIFFDISSMPAQLKNDQEVLAYVRSLCHHELTHFTLYPASRQQEVKLFLAAYKGFKDKKIKDDPIMARSCVFIANNMFGDLIGDSYLAILGYGKRNLGPLTIWRDRMTIRHCRMKYNFNPSPLWKVAVTLHETLWKTDLGFSRFGRLYTREKKVLSKLLYVLGDDWMVEERWPHKIRYFAAALEPLLLDLEVCGTRYVELPVDFAEMCGNACDSSLGSDTKSIDDNVLLKLLEENRTNPGAFAGCVSSLTCRDAKDGLRLMYRSRAKEIAIKLDRTKASSSDSSAKHKVEDWEPGDPVAGKSGLRMLDSFISHGRPIPWINTRKNLSQPLHEKGQAQAIYDLLLIIDSSGSMSWNPYAAAPEKRGRYDRAALAGESAALYAIEHGARVAVINFSGPGDLRDTKHFTRSLDRIERVLLSVSLGGTMFPVKQFEKFLAMTRNPLLTLLLSDCELFNEDETVSVLRKAVKAPDRLCVFQTNYGPLNHFSRRMADVGAEVYAIERAEDLVNLIIGRVARQYVSFNEVDFLTLVGDEDD